MMKTRLQAKKLNKIQKLKAVLKKLLTCFSSPKQTFISLSKMRLRALPKNNHNRRLFPPKELNPKENKLKTKTNPI